MNSKSFYTKSIATAVTAFMMIFLLWAQPAEAGWDDRSDELPGMDDSSLTPILVTSAVVLTAIVVFKMATGGDDKTDAPVSTPEDPTNDTDESSSSDLSDCSGDYLDNDKFNKNIASIMQLDASPENLNRLPGVAPIIGFDCEQVVIGIGVTI